MIDLSGGPYDGKKWSNRNFPRCPEVIGFTDETEGGIHIYSTDGPSETVNEFPSTADLPKSVRDKIEESIKSGESKEIEFDHTLYYEGVVKRTDVLNLYQKYREGES